MSKQVELPSIRNIHLQALHPCTPLRLCWTPYAIRPFILPATAIIEKKIAPRVASSSRLYHSVRYSGPACKNASIAPIKTRTPAIVCQFVALQSLYDSQRKHVIVLESLHSGSQTPTDHRQTKLSVWTNHSNEQVTGQLEDNISDVEEGNTLAQLV